MRRYWLLGVILVALATGAPTCKTTIPLENASFESPVIEDTLEQRTPDHWTLTQGEVRIYRPGPGDRWYGKLPDGAQALNIKDNSHLDLATD